MNLELLLSQLITLVPFLLSWISKKLKKQRDIYAPKRTIFCNSALYDRIMGKFLISIFVFLVMTFLVLMTDTCFRIFSNEIIEWIVIFCISYTIQVLILGRENYGLNRYGDKKSYTLCMYLFIGIIDIDTLASYYFSSTKNVAGNAISYIMECVLILFFSIYILNKKRVTYCERVILDLGYGKERTIAREDFYLEEDGSVIITNQNSSKEQINGSYIRKKTAVYSEEYVQWCEKINNMSNEKKSMKKDDKDIQWLWALVMAVIPIVISIVDYGNFGFEFGVIHQIICQHESIVSDLFAQQMTISTIFIAVASLAVNGINDRFVGTSTKHILFKRFIYNPNYITLILILLALNVSSFVAYLFQSKWGIVFSFILSLVWLFRLLSLTYYLLSKKSKIYFKILKRLKAEDSKVYEVMLKKLKSLVDEKEKGQHDKHDSYFVEEMLILHKLKEIATKRECEEDCSIIEKAVRVYIEREERELPILELLFQEYEDNDCEETIKWMEEISYKQELSIGSTI